MVSRLPALPPPRELGTRRIDLEVGGLSSRHPRLADQGDSLTLVRHRDDAHQGLAFGSEADLASGACEVCRGRPAARGIDCRDETSLVHAWASYYGFPQASETFCLECGLDEDAWFLRAERVSDQESLPCARGWRALEREISLYVAVAGEVIGRWRGSPPWRPRGDGGQKLFLFTIFRMDASSDLVADLIDRLQHGVLYVLESGPCRPSRAIPSRMTFACA